MVIIFTSQMIIYPKSHRDNICESTTSHSYNIAAMLILGNQEKNILMFDLAMSPSPNEMSDEVLTEN